MSKVLIYHSVSMLKPTGGPNGYLYSLKSGLDKIEDKNIKIDFLPETSQQNTLKNWSKASKKTAVKWFLRTYRTLKHIRQNLSILNTTRISPVDLNAYDAVHFHKTCDLYYLRDSLKDYKGKVLLTSHSPQPLSDELIESSSPLEIKLFGKKYSHLIEMDAFAFKRADYIIFPCEYADEPYCSAWQEYKKIREDKKEQYRYLLTGTVPAHPGKSREDMRKQYGIPEDAFVVSYVGRHSEIKGYDRLKVIGEELLKRYSNVYMFVAGNIGPLNPPKHERWIEVGWTNDPHSVITASDVFVLPNRETYFDLVLLEVLSTGTTVVASRTGGNKHFCGEPGVKLFDTEADAIALVEENMQYSKERKAVLEEGNQVLFHNHFTTDIFALNYLEVLKSIL